MFPLLIKSRFRRSFSLRKDFHRKTLILILLLLALPLSFWNRQVIHETLVQTYADNDLTAISPTLTPFLVNTVVLDGFRTISYTLSASSVLASLDLHLVLKTQLKHGRFPRETLPFFEEELRRNMANEKWITSHWFQLSVSKVWLESEKLFFVVYQILYVPDDDDDSKMSISEKQPLISFIYADFQSLMGATIEDYSYNGALYPSILPLTTYNEDHAVFPGPLNINVVYSTIEDGTHQPLILFNSLSSSTDNKLYWIQPGSNSNKWEPQRFSLNKDSNYDNWIPLFDRSDPHYVYDTHILFLDGMSVIKCSLENGSCEGDPPLKPNRLQNFVDHTPLLSIKSFLPPSGVDLNGIKDIWLGFSNLLLELCGCGTRMYRPTIVVYVMDDHNSMHMVQLSQMIDFNLSVGNRSSINDECISVSGISAHSIEIIDNQIMVMVTTSGGLSYEIIVDGLSKELARGLSYLDLEREGSSPDYETVLISSQSYCNRVSNVYGGGDVAAVAAADSENDDRQLILYPNYIKNPEDHYRANFGIFDKSKQKIVQLGDSVPRNGDVDKRLHDYLFNPQTVHLYDAFTDLEDKTSNEECSRTAKEFHVGFSKPIDMTGKFSDYISKYIHRDITISQSQLDYFFEYKDFMESRMEEMLRDKDSIDQFWTRFGGASVFFEEFGVYLMLSRVIYSPIKERDQPSFSMTFLQVFDKDWNELKNVEMVVPDTENNDPNSNGFNRFTYPEFARIASYHDSSVDKIKSYGPEDPRLLIRKNHLGHEEPMLIFTQLQRDISEGQHGDTISKEYRSMFYSLPWEVQVGKSLVDPVVVNDKAYYKTVELSIFDQETNKFLEKRPKEKNWTPFFSPTDRRASNGVDKSIYFVYLWEYLQILKCDIPNSSQGETSVTKCIIVFHNKPEKDFVGSFRGGTQLISVNDLITTLPTPYNELPQEYWIGYARSHIAHCGCGEVMYRPQVAIVTRSKDMTKFQVSHVSSFMGFHMDVLPYTNKVCERANVFLPNGLSKWHILASQESENELDDVVTLFYTLADKVQGRFHIRGLLSHLLGLKAFEWNDQLMTPDNRPTDPYLVLSHIKCSEIRSRQFCKAYGLEHPN